MSNLPNILSAFRLFLVPFFPILYFSGLPDGATFAGIIFIAAGISDVLDGFIARKFDYVSATGRMLDPLADKLMQLSALTTLTIDQKIPYWFFVLFTVKELAMIGGGFRLYKKNSDVIPSNGFGKLTAVLFYLVVLVVLFFEIPPLATDIMLVLLLFIAVFSTGVYYTGYKSTIKK